MIIDANRDIDSKSYLSHGIFARICLNIRQYMSAMSHESYDKEEALWWKTTPIRFHELSSSVVTLKIAH